VYFTLGSSPISQLIGFGDTAYRGIGTSLQSPAQNTPPAVSQHIMTMQNTKFSTVFNESKLKAIKEINKCLHPNCNKSSIKSHILQKNGILSVISPTRHLYEQVVDLYKTPPVNYKKTGINDVFSFKCFCKEHDEELFQGIEKGKIDFENYRHQVLLVLRTSLNEKFKKLVGIRQYEIVLNEYPEFIGYMHNKGWYDQEKLGVNDMEKIEVLLWSDLYNGTKYFEFSFRELSLKQVCISSIFTYETTIEIENYRNKNGIDKDELIELFINLIPYESKTYLIFGYEKRYENIVKGYVNSFIKENEKRTERRITNLMLFQCENWVCSENFYENKIKNNIDLFYEATKYSQINFNERKNFDVNIFNDKFSESLKSWYKQIS
jgi:hypothetical protein